jgi:hypothetical protein
MYKDLDSRKETFTYLVTNETDGDASDPYVMRIGKKHTFNSADNSKEPYLHAQMGMIAHETGHKFRNLYGLDPSFPTKIGGKIGDDDYSSLSEYNVQFQNAHETSEKGALHIENIVRSELKRSGKFGSVQVKQFYSPGFTIKTEFDINKGVKRTLNMIHNYDLFDNGKYNREYYENEINIYKELGINRP